jgi:hypothetical protein
MATIRHKMGRIVGVRVCGVPVKQPTLAFTIRPGRDVKKEPRTSLSEGAGKRR